MCKFAVRALDAENSSRRIRGARVESSLQEFPMLRLAALVPLIAAPFVFASLNSMQVITPSQPACSTALVHEPVVIYDIAGSTLLGPFFQHLAVYNDGHAILSATTSDPDPGKCQTSFLTNAELVQLRQDLAN